MWNVIYAAHWLADSICQNFKHVLKISPISLFRLPSGHNCVTWEKKLGIVSPEACCVNLVCVRVCECVLVQVFSMRHKHSLSCLVQQGEGKKKFLSVCGGCGQQGVCNCILGSWVQACACACVRARACACAVSRVLAALVCRAGVSAEAQRRRGRREAAVEQKKHEWTLWTLLENGHNIYDR